MDPFELKPETRSRQTYRGFMFRLKNNGETEVWADTLEAQNIWRNIDENTKPWDEASNYIFCGFWRPPTIESLRAAIDSLWGKHG